MNEIAWRYAPSLVEDALARVLPDPAQDLAHDDGRARLRRAMRFAVFSGGKRLRSQLVLETAGVISAGFDALKALPAACALEIIHAYSLVHDDLPAMDNADTRRGRASCHREFGEATAILVGDALLTLAFEIATTAMPDHPVEADTLLRAAQVVARAAGEAGMVGGQAIDIAWSTDGGQHVQGPELFAMHALKTGALIRAACEVGALIGGASALQMQKLSDYGAHLGRAFQIHDDVLDVEGDPHLTGKSATDTINDKLTAPAVFGLSEAKQLAVDASEAAVAALKEFGERAATLRQLAYFVVQREK